MKYIYTIGNCSGVSHAEAKEWRDKIQRYFKSNTFRETVKVINITDYYSYETKFHESDKEIADFCERSIKKADAVIVNNYKLDSSGGSQREIGLAKAYNIPIFVFDDVRISNVYSWDKVWAERIFSNSIQNLESSSNLEDCCAHVLKYIINA